MRSGSRAQLLKQPGDVIASSVAYLQSRVVTERGATMVEYALVLAVIVLVAVASVNALSDTTGKKLVEVRSCVENPVIGGC